MWKLWKKPAKIIEPRENEPEWDRLREICQEAERLIAAGKWNWDEFSRLHAQAEIAVHGHTEFLECLDHYPVEKPSK